MFDWLEIIFWANVVGEHFFQRFIGDDVCTLNLYFLAKLFMISISTPRSKSFPWITKGFACDAITVIFSDEFGSVFKRWLEQSVIATKTQIKTKRNMCDILSEFSKLLCFQLWNDEQTDQISLWLLRIYTAMLKYVLERMG